MKKCRCAYYDRWHSEWVCGRYEQPMRMCCPCGRPDIGDSEDRSEWELFDGGFKKVVDK